MFPCEDSKTVSVCPSVCLSVCPSVRLSVCPHPEKRYHHSFVNISPTLVNDTSMERSSRVLHHGNPEIWFFFQKSLKFEFWLLTKSWNHLSFVNISHTLVIDTSMERFSRVLHHGNPKIWFFFSKKFEIRILTFDEELKSPYLRQYQSYISKWCINGKVFTSTTPWKPENLNFFSKKFEIRILTFDEELKSPYLRQYQSYISNWYINGKVFTSTTPWKPRNLIFFFKKVWNSNFDFWRRAEITLASSLSVLH